ncbi:CPBP family glutamic-type intramembrane protease [Algoriphagus machipongonensis]|uniref:CAAX amino protease family protein n=1 Tax=Algoriphagus machipongonensis TaxID=388413 RepID=A3HWU9_9BACT|nr:CAAX amino protease family protein [Algoriphagus machipongonensis]
MVVLIKDIFFFLTSGRKVEETFKSNRKLIFNLYILKAGIFLLFVFLNFFLFNFKIDGRVEGYVGLGFFKDLINYLILAPILEEILFRYHNNLKIGNIIASLIATCLIFYDHIWFLSLLILYFLVLILISSLKKEVDNLVIVYVSAFIFGASHLAYIEGSFSFEDILSYVYIFLPKFLSGLIYSYVFFKKGICFSILLHFLWNLLPFIIDQITNSL